PGGSNVLWITLAAAEPISTHATPSSPTLDPFGRWPQVVCRRHPVPSDRASSGRYEVSAQTGTDELQVWVDQDLCTGDGLCVQYAPEVFEFDIDGLAYVKDSAGELLQSPGVRTGVPARLQL